MDARTTEVKGMEKEQNRPKRTAARKWVNAVNHYGGFGTWDLMICKEPNSLRGMLEGYKTARDS